MSLRYKVFTLYSQIVLFDNPQVLVKCQSSNTWDVTAWEPNHSGKSDTHSSEVPEYFLMKNTDMLLKKT